MKKRIAALMLSICMMISILPTSAFAVPDVEEAYPITQEETAPEVQAAEQEAPALQEAALDVPEEDPAIEVQTAEITDEPAAEVQAEPEQQPALEAAEPASEAEPEVQPEVQEQPVEETEAAAQPEASTEEQPAEDETEQSEVETEPASEETGSEETAEEPSEEETETSVPDDTALFALGGDTAMYVATDTVAGEATVYVGKTITLTGTTNGCKGWANWNGSSGEYYDDTWTTSNSGVATVSNGVVTGVSSGTATITHTYCKGDQYQYNYYTQTGNYAHQLVNETFTVTVKEIVAPTAIKISGEKEVKVYETIQLSTLLEPEDAYADITWESSDTGILTVDATGAVYGVSEGTATVTAYAGSLTANISITVKAAEQETASARFFFLKDPSKDYTANESANWSELTNGSSGTINVKNIVWQGGANNYETSRVLTWPDGSTGSTYTVAKGTAAWNTIFDAFSASYGVTDKDDVESIILTPYKISSHAYNGDGNHVDCTVTIVAKSVCTVLYKLLDVGDSLWSNVETYKLHPGDTTAPEKTYPATKTVNGVEYTFMGWYTNPQLSGDPVDFTGGYTVNGNTEFYAKYVAGYNVIYNANGGVWRGKVTNPCLEGHTFTISANTPTREGYTFEGWESSYDGETYQWGSKQSFVMPGCNVVLKAKWKVNTYTVTWNNYNGEELKKDTKVEYGTMPSYDGETPVKPEDAQFTYEFSGWTPKLSKVTKDITYTAQFTPVEKTFTVTWVNYDGKELEKDENVAYNSDPSYDGETPVKPEDEQFTYTFAGWNPKLSKVTNNITYTAQFTPVEKTFTVTWVNYDGTELEKDENVAYNSDPSYDGETPVKPEDGQFTYEFKGWNPTLSKVTNNITYTAQFTPVEKTFTVTWVNYDGTELEKDENVAYNSDPSYDGKTPVKPEDEQFTYTFAGWSPKLSKVTNNITYTVQFTPVEKTFTVTWVNYDGSELEKDENVAYNSDPSYDGKTPEKPEDGQFTYEFKGWTPKLSKVTNNITYTAQFTPVEKTFTVTWVNYDGKELEKDENVAYNSAPSYDGETPVKPEDEQFTYTFAGWNPKLSKVTNNITYTAQFTPVEKTFTVTWVNYDGTELEKDENVAYNSDPSYDGETPVKPEDGQFTYEFKGWNPTLSKVTKNITYTAQFTPVEKTFTVRWVNYDGSELEKDENVAYNSNPSYDGETPVKPEDGQFTYTFAGWSPELSKVTNNITYTAQYEANLRSYQVTYDLNEGSWLSTENKFTYENGSTVAVSTFVPTREGYNFLGWKSSEDGEDADLLHGDDVFTMPTHDVTLTAQWAIKTYTIKWVDGNGNVLKEETVEHGTTPSYDGDTPKKDADEQFTYTFDKWDKDPEPATRDMTYTAEFTPSAIPTPTPSTEPTPSTTPTPSTEPSPSTAPTPSTEPTPSTTPTPSTEPTPSTAPTPSTQPSAEPSTQPSAEPGTQPSAEPSTQPSAEPSTQPSVEPSTQPSAEPSTQPSVQPTPSTTPVVPAVQPVPSIQPNPTPVPAVITTPTPTPSPAATPAVTPENTPDQTVTPVPEDGEIIPDEEVPTAPGVDEPAQPEELEAIADDATPLAGGRGGHWALINLILAILTVLASLLLLIGYIGKKKKALEDEDGNKVKDEDGNTVWEYEKKKKGFWRVFSLIPAIVSVIAFILTENMRLPMRLVDRWTLLMVIIAIVQIVVAVLCKKRKNKDDEDRDDQQNQDAATVTA